MADIMVKHKTKKQKLKTEKRRQVSINENGYSFENLGMPVPLVTKTSAQTYNPTITKDHSYVLPEIKQTVLVISAIIVSQIILATLLKTGLINTPF